jgi:rod shape-determining protein MreC
MPRKRTLFFFSIVVISFVVMTYQSREGHRPPDNFLNTLLILSHRAATSLTDAAKSPFEKMAVRADENARLKKRIDELLTEREQYREAVLENKRLKEILGLKEERKNYVCAARIIARGIDRWEHILVIDKGQKDGVEKDMCAVTPRGLAGKILTASDSHASLLLLTDINFSASVRLQESRKEGILSGTGTRKCILKYVPYDEKVHTGDIVVTSGLDSLFPPGVPVGYVSKVDQKGLGGNFQYIEVIPFQDDTKMEEVAIVR